MLYDIYLNNENAVALYVFPVSVVSDKPLNENKKMSNGNNPIIYRKTIQEAISADRSICWSCYDKLFPKALIVASSVRFAPYIRGEDKKFNLDLFADNMAALVIKTNYYIYCYRQRESSCMHLKDKKHIEKVAYSNLDKVCDIMKRLMMYPPVLQDILRETILDIQIRTIFTPLSYSSLCRLLKVAKARGIYPIANPHSCAQKAINILVNLPVLAYWTNLFYCKVLGLDVYRPYIKW